MPTNIAFIPYDHYAVIGDLYYLPAGLTLTIGDVVEFTTDPPTLFQPSTGEDFKYLVRRGCENYTTLDDLSGTGPDDAIGLSFNRIVVADLERLVAVVLHGFAVARACSLATINANEPFKCCSSGQITRLNRVGLTALEVANYKMGKAVTQVPANLLGVVFLQ